MKKTRMLQFEFDFQHDNPNSIVHWRPAERKTAKLVADIIFKKSMRKYVSKGQRNLLRQSFLPQWTEIISLMFSDTECDVPVPGIPVPGNSSFFLWYRNRNQKNLVPKKVLEPESKKFGTEKESRNRSRKILVPKKVSEPVSKNFGTEKKYRNQSRNFSEY